MYGFAFSDRDFVRPKRQKEFGHLRDVKMIDSASADSPAAEESDSPDPGCSNWFEDRAFLLLRITGLTERPSLILQNKVSLLFRLYCIVMNVLSIYFWFQSAIFIFFPHLCFLPVLPFLETMTLSQGMLYMMWNSMCVAMRAAISVVTLCPAFGKSLQSSMSMLKCDKQLLATCRQQKFWLFLSNATTVLLTVLVMAANISMYNQSPPKITGQVDYLRYSYMLQSFLFATSWIFGCQFLYTVALGTLRRMFNVVASDFEKWANAGGQSAKEFQVALERHTVAWRLTETFDRVFSFVIGVNFIFSIPMICMMTSQTVRLLNERHIHPQLLELLWFLVPWNGSCIFFTILTCTFAATVNTAAHKPRHCIYKMRHGSDNPDVLHFLHRLKDASIGFSFFRFFVIQKTTLLSIFSLTVTYLIVFLQMAQFTSANSFTANGSD